MPTYRVRRGVDAYVYSEAEVEADSPHEAATKARDHEEDYKWEEVGEGLFDARYFITLDADGNEIAETQRDAG